MTVDYQGHLGDGQMTRKDRAGGTRSLKRGFSTVQPRVGAPFSRDWAGDDEMDIEGLAPEVGETLRPTWREL